MNRQAKELWLKALRSGEYGQAETKLCKINPDGSRGYCCLGVLTEVAIEGGFVEMERRSHYQVAEAEYTVYVNPGDEDPDGGFYAYTPDAVAEWADLPASNPTVKHVMVNDWGNEAEYTDSLADLNDDVGLNFEQIADLIEEQL